MALIYQILILSVQVKRLDLSVTTFRLQCASLLFGFDKRCWADQVSGTRRDDVRRGATSFPGLLGTVCVVVRRDALDETTGMEGPVELPLLWLDVFAFLTEGTTLRPDLLFCDVVSVSSAGGMEGS